MQCSSQSKIQIITTINLSRQIMNELQYHCQLPIINTFACRTRDQCHARETIMLLYSSTRFSFLQNWEQSLNYYYSRCSITGSSVYLFFFSSEDIFIDSSLYRQSNQIKSNQTKPNQTKPNQTKPI